MAGDAPTAFPLAWPRSRPRTDPVRRRVATFGTAKRSSAGIKAPLTVADARQRLQDELDRIGARSAVLSTDVELRLDGQPRSGREPADPGVAVYFQLDGRPHCMPCDTYTRVADNIAAVAAHIEATRAIERHGVASVAEMFSGFVALPPPRAWHEILGTAAEATRDEIEAAYRVAAKRAHPDRPGGSHDAMAALNAAREEGLRHGG